MVQTENANCARCDAAILRMRTSAGTGVVLEPGRLQIFVEQGFPVLGHAVHACRTPTRLGLTPAEAMALATAIADELFLAGPPGHVELATRLELKLDNGSGIERSLGGLCFEAARDRIYDELMKQPAKGRKKGRG